MLDLTWNDVGLKKDDKGQYVSIRLRWHKKANVKSDCQIYNLVDEPSFPCLQVCSIFEVYLRMVQKSGPNLSSGAFVFPSFQISGHEIPIVNWYKTLDQNQVRLYLKNIIEKNSDLPVGISLHSMRRGGSFYRVFESPERKFNFRELMAWCRWADAKTCCEYLITRNLSDGLDPRNLLRSQKVNNDVYCVNGNIGESDDVLNKICSAIAETISNIVPTKQRVNRQSPILKRQKGIDTFIKQTIIPTASSAREAWNQWFLPVPEQGLFQPLNKFSKEMIRLNRKKYSERLILSRVYSHLLHC
jgi:hypothetical protein